MWAVSSAVNTSFLCLLSQKWWQTWSRVYREWLTPWHNGHGSVSDFCIIIWIEHRCLKRGDSQSVPSSCAPWRLSLLTIIHTSANNMPHSWETAQVSLGEFMTVCFHTTMQNHQLQSQHHKELCFLGFVGFGMQCVYTPRQVVLQQQHMCGFPESPPCLAHCQKSCPTHL